MARPKRGRKKPKRQQVKDLSSGMPPTVIPDYEPGVYPPERLDSDKVVSQLGPPIDGWTPELIYRYAILMPDGLNVNWAIMTDVYRLDDDGKIIRRSVERIDICESAIHVHTFRRSDDPDDDQGRRRVLMPISAGDAAIVSRAFDEQLHYLSLEWQQRVRRWIDG